MRRKPWLRTCPCCNRSATPLRSRPPCADVAGCLPVVQGGATRQDSVRAGLEALVAHEPDIVLVHDAARPVIPEGTIPALLAALRESPGAIPAAPVADTLKRVVRGVITETVPAGWAVPRPDPPGVSVRRGFSLPTGQA